MPAFIPKSLFRVVDPVKQSVSLLKVSILKSYHAAFCLETEWNWGGKGGGGLRPRRSEPALVLISNL